jgi:hypothetical protein
MAEKEFILPTEKIKAKSLSPKLLLMYSSPKVGKTTAASMLNKSILFELEPRGADFVDAIKVDITCYEDIIRYCQKIKESSNKYKFGIIDTISALEDMILPLAGKLYRDTIVGKNWGKLEDGTDDIKANVLKLPNGAGYQYAREAFFKVLDYFNECFEYVILMGHLKDKYITIDSKEVSAKEIDLQGKNKNLACAKADAIGILYRKENKTILSFKTDDTTACGSRPTHLRNKDVVLLEEVDGKLVEHWDEIYID